MDAFKIAIKLFAARDELDPGAFVPVFHRWIQNQSLADHMLIDVADYAHVSAGPGTVLVCREANLSSDRAHNRLGLLYFRKLPMDGSFADRAKSVMRSTLHAAALLEADQSLFGHLSFTTGEWLFRIHDRLLAPNTTETFAMVQPHLESLTRHLYGQPAQLEFTPSPLTVFEVRVKSTQSPPLTTLLDRLK
jgi:hypothetical protein